MKARAGQLSIISCLKIPVCSVMHCKDCLCKQCLFWWSGRCPVGECFDDARAKETPYDQAHKDRPPRTTWSDWNKPGEQAHWCRGGIFYPTGYCEHYRKYLGSQIKTCLKANVQVFQDGYISCSLIESSGCEVCYREFEEKLEDS